MFSVAPSAMVSAPSRSPPSQFIVPPTVRTPLPLIAPLEKVRLLTATGVLFVTAAPTDTIAVSAAPGTWLGDQLAAVFQFPPVLLVHVMVAASTVRIDRATEMA